MTTFIGGNLQAIEDSAARLDSTGSDALATGDRTKSAADELEAAIESATQSLNARFDTIAGELRDAIAAAHTQLEAADWQGQSRENALRIKANLQSQVGQVLGAATETLVSEKSAFVNRAGQLVAHVETQFKGVMRTVDEEYAGLAKAARATRANLESADQTIRMA